MPNHKKIDKTDVKILELLQQDSRITTAQLSEELSLSTSPCWRRVKQLEDTKIIKGYGVLLDRKKINLVLSKVQKCLWKFQSLVQI